MARIVDLVQMPDGRVGVVLDVPPDAGNSITLWTEAERETHLREAAKAEELIERYRARLTDFIEMFAARPDLRAHMGPAEEAVINRAITALTRTV